MIPVTNSKVYVLTQVEKMPKVSLSLPRLFLSIFNIWVCAIHAVIKAMVNWWKVVLVCTHIHTFTGSQLISLFTFPTFV